MTTDVNEQFVLTESWSQKLRNNLRSFYQTIYFGPPIFVLLNVMFCFAFQKGTDIGFWVMFLPLTILSTIYCMLLPRKAIRRYKNIIHTLEFRSKTEIRLILIDGKILTLNNYEIHDTSFNMDKTEKDSKLIVDKNDGIGYTLIIEAFANVPTWNSVSVLDEPSTMN